MEKLVCLLVFVGVFHAGYAIKCYNCESSASNECTDYSKIPTIECSPLKDSFPPVCIRRILKGVSGTGRNISLLCTNKLTGNECFSPSLSYNVTDCKICQQDFCNSNGHTHANLALIAILGLSSLFFVGKYF